MSSQTNNGHTILYWRPWTRPTCLASRTSPPRGRASIGSLTSLPMEVTIATPTVTITPGAGLPVVVNLGPAIDVGIVKSERKQATLVSDTDPTGYVTVDQYLVQIDLFNRRIAEIAMGQVDNHAEWTNDEAGALQCQADITAAIPV